MEESTIVNLIETAYQVSRGADCNRLSVGALVVRNNVIIGEGSNNAPKGNRTCLEEGCMMVDNSCKRAVHAEVNAILDAYQEGYTNLEGAIIVCTDRPCGDCSKFIEAVGIKTVYFNRMYRGFYEYPSSLDFIQADRNLELAHNE